MLRSVSVQDGVGWAYLLVEKSEKSPVLCSRLPVMLDSNDV